MAPTAKGSAYDKRNHAHTVVPMEIDSDPDFNPGVYIPQDKPKKKTKRKGGLTGKGRKRPRDEDSEDDFELPKAKKQYRPQTQATNPLLKYFNEDDSLDLKSASEAEDEDDEEEEEEEEPESDDGAAGWAIVKKTLDAVKKPTPLPPPKPIEYYDGSTEESDEEDAPVVQHQSANANDDDSKTESDSEADPIHPSIAKEASGSDTETDEDEDPIPAGTSMVPKPGFPLKDGQIDLGPLVLDSSKGYRIPGPINTYLRDYQRDGARFFCRRYIEGKGGLLGDDMGLVRKTIQVISFLSAIMKKDGAISDVDRRRNHVSKLQDGEGWRKRKELPPADATWPTCLIIAPSTVVHNWERELQTWGYFEVGMYNGNAEERKRVLLDFKMGRLDLLVTSFDLARRDIDLLDDLPFSCIFVDEAHRLKNIKAQITQAYHQFKCMRRFGLTGTAIQNSYEELYTILDWTNPGSLGTPKQWKGFIQTPLIVGQSSGATPDEVAKSTMVSDVLHRKILPDIFLRRTKDIIKDQLPKKFDQVVFCPLSEVQIDAYKRVLGSPVVHDLIHKDDPCSCGSGLVVKKCCGPYKPEEVLRHVSILMKLSNHLALILPSQSDTKEQLERNRALAKVVFPDKVPMFAEAVMQSRYCGKWDTLNTLLKTWKKDPTNKVLIFTKAVKLMDMLEFLLKRRDYGFLKLDGSTKQSDRMGLIDQFQNDPSVFIFLISTLAGGTGLNLTSANHVVIFDPNWNPAHDLQAMDRAFRFGQTRDVYVYRLLGAGSLEEIIYARQLYKQQQMAIGYDASIQTRYFEGVQGDRQKQGELFGLKNLFSLQEDTLATKMAIEKATISNLDWALANISSKGLKKKSDDQKKLLDADRSLKDETLQGLGTLLFDDDAVPKVKEDKMADMQKALKATGVKYIHRNEDVLAPNKITTERVKTLVKTTKRRKKKGDSPPAAPWPPVRRHHVKKALSTEQRLKLKRETLEKLNMINGPGDLEEFTAEFLNETPEAQENIFKMLDGVSM